MQFVYKKEHFVEIFNYFFERADRFSVHDRSCYSFEVGNLMLGLKVKLDSVVLTTLRHFSLKFASFKALVDMITELGIECRVMIQANIDFGVRIRDEKITKRIFRLMESADKLILHGSQLEICGSIRYKDLRELLGTVDNAYQQSLTEDMVDKL